MKTLEELKKSLERVKIKQMRLFKEKAASPLDIIKKAQECTKEIAALEKEIQDYEPR